jgi:hypothetical protein
VTGEAGGRGLWEQEPLVDVMTWVRGAVRAVWPVDQEFAAALAAPLSRLLSVSGSAFLARCGARTDGLRDRMSGLSAPAPR